MLNSVVAVGHGGKVRRLRYVEACAMGRIRAFSVVANRKMATPGREQRGHSGRCGAENA